MKFYIGIICALFFIKTGSSQEEPPKFLFEKAEKEQLRNRIRENRIQSTTSRMYAAKEGMKVEPGVKTMLWEYDSSGRVQLFLSFHYDSILRRIEYTYDKAGNLFTSSEYGPDKNLLENTAFYYDNAGRLVSGISFDGNNEKKGYFRLVREDSIHQIRFIQYTQYNQPQFTVYYIFPVGNDSSDYIFATHQDKYGNLTSFVEKKHNAHGKTIEQKIFNPDRSLKYTFIYQYNDQGSISGITKKWPDASIEWTEEYDYGPGGICTSIRHYNEKRVLQWVTQFEETHFPK